METSVEILAPASAAWKLLADTSRWPEWGPSVSRVESAEQYIGPASSGRVQTIIGVWLPFRVTKFVVGQRWDWEVAGIPATSHRVESLGPDHCRVVFKVPLLAAPYLTVCRWAVQRIKSTLEEEQHRL